MWYKGIFSFLLFENSPLFQRAARGDLILSFLSELRENQISLNPSLTKRDLIFSPENCDENSDRHYFFRMPSIGD